MKPFNIKEYNDNPSRKVVTRDGRSVRILCTNARRSYPIVALIEDKDNKEDILCAYLPDGTRCGITKNYDLFFAPVKREGWINVFKQNCYETYSGKIYKTKQDAVSYILNHPSIYYITTTKIEWEE